VCKLVDQYEHNKWPGLVFIGTLKELEHSNVGRKVLILKYDLDKSLSKEM